MATLIGAADAVRLGVRQAERFFSQLTGAGDDPASKGAARVLMRAIRKQLSIKVGAAHTSLKSRLGKSKNIPRVYGEPSAPGEAPRSATGALRRSVGTEVVGGIRRVGVANFKGRLLEEGVDTTVQVTPSARVFGKRRRKAGASRRTLRIAPRPFMAKALEEALPGMEGEAVSALQKRGDTISVFA